MLIITSSQLPGGPAAPPTPIFIVQSEKRHQRLTMDSADAISIGSLVERAVDFFNAWPAHPVSRVVAEARRTKGGKGEGGPRRDADLDRLTFGYEIRARRHSLGCPLEG
mmetsp:Transcript_4784/g.10276  ORF Transcript_4784/g.10276 Transcript_4784/m.10276 type:complete len:109 (-) Transcript_4784:236-562(-)